MIPIFWQKFWEEKLNINDEIEIKVDDQSVKIKDCYQFHAFILKKNSYYMTQRRFMVLSQLWMFNVEAEFDKKKKVVEYKKMKWRLPLASIVSVQLSKTDERITLNIKTDLKT